MIMKRTLTNPRNLLMMILLLMIPLSAYRPELRGTVVYPPAFDAATH